jgi:CRISPR system Cascade subunit CasE
MFLSLLHVNMGKDPDHPTPGRKWLGDTYRVHQRLWMAFADDKRCDEDQFFLGVWAGPSLPERKPQRHEAGFLFRIEHDGYPRILVQSVEEPKWDYAFQNAPYLLARKPDVKKFDPSPLHNESYRFRLLANVVNPKSVVHPNGKMRTTGSGLTIQCRKRTEMPVFPLPMPDPLPVDPIERRKVLLARWDPWREWLRHMGTGRGFHVVDEQASPLLMEAVHTIVRNPGKVRGGSNQDKPTEKRYNAGLFEGLFVCADPDRLRDAVINGVGHSKAFGFGLLSIAPVRI